MSDNRRVALALVDRGIPTFPVEPRHKTPLTDHGFRDRSRDPGLVRLWIEQFPGCIWGLVPSDVGAVAFDVDSASSHVIARRLGLTGHSTYLTLTPAGQHLFYRKADDLTGGFNISLVDVGTATPDDCKPADKLVVRIDAGYVVAPGCVRADGKSYRAVGTFACMLPLPSAVDAFFRHYHDVRPTEPPTAPPRPIDPQDSVIAGFNRLHSVADILSRNKYKAVGKRFVAPESSSGLPGVVVLDGKAYSHHASDPLADGHAHDAFSLFTLLEHGGDVRAAVRAAGDPWARSNLPATANRFSPKRTFGRRVFPARLG